MPAQQIRVLAIDPFARGFGFAILEGAECPIDWGVKEARKDKAALCMRQIVRLIECYRPDVLVVEDWRDPGCRRCPRVRALIQEILELATNRKVKTRRFSRRVVRATFAHCGAFSKHEIAGAIVKQLPDLSHLQPPIRKLWMSEDYRENIFDAFALALVVFSCTNSTIISAGREGMGRLLG